ncbi:MAG TPA: hypothetical protein PLP27_10365 [Crocinitomicaceae bacterium]|nr:hypothetical protein [Crocinitomicaceae bacterium]
MKKLMSHIVRLFCLSAVFLLVSNVTFNSWEISKNSSSSELIIGHLKKNKFDNGQHISSTNRGADMYKDPTDDDDCSTKYLLFDLPSFFCNFESYILDLYTDNLAYNPNFPRTRLWIQYQHLLI